MGLIEMIELASLRFMPAYGAMQLKLLEIYEGGSFDKLIHRRGNKEAS
jgi:hypothetical protein